ncbi:MAG TPA: hypothetical protein VGR47_14310 [Terracidiphilus sp.]|nr:hypothetical protein [Terracidiphilus sp.]
MTPKRIIPIALLVLAGVLSASAAFYGATSLIAGAHHAHGTLLIVFSISLILLLPFFCVMFFRPRLSVVLQLSIGVVFLVVNYTANMRECGNGHVCPGAVSIAITAFLQPVTLLPFMIAALQLLSIYMREWAEEPQGASRSI